MPEIKEFIHALLRACKRWEEIRDQNLSTCRVKGLFYDATESEAEKFPADSRLHDGLVDVLDPSHKVLRGSRGGQTALWPSMVKSTEDLGTLELTEITGSYRNLTLVFGDEAVLQIAFLLHTSLQIYTTEQWERVASVNKKDRGFKIGLAIQFDNFVLSFNSFDNVFQPIWETSKSKLDIPPHVVTERTAFLQHIATWIASRAKSGDRTGSAMDAVRKANKFWYGIGAYTVQELFYMAGLSPFLTEEEVFSCPSRTARLCSAYRALAIETDRTILDRLAASEVDGVLAPTLPQRLEASELLHIYMKDRVFMSARMATMLDNYNRTLASNSERSAWSRLDDGMMPPDVYEPTYSQDDICNDENLLHLIFGQHGCAQLGIDLRSDAFSDPLSVLFKAQGRLSSPTFLDVAQYTTSLVLGPEHLRKSWRQIKAYGEGPRSEKRTIWTPLDIFPSNSQISNGTTKKRRRSNNRDPDMPFFSHLVRLEDDVRKANLFRNRIQTNQVAIGPLEYCGNGFLVKRQSTGETMLAVCAQDPAIGEFYNTRNEKTSAWRSVSFSQKGKRRQTPKARASALRKSQKNKEVAKSPQPPNGLDASREVLGAIENSLPKPKRRRVSAEKRAIIEALQPLDHRTRTRACPPIN